MEERLDPEMQKDTPQVPMTIPQYVYPEDEISLIDLWLIIVKHKKIFLYVFSAIVLIGLIAALVMPKKYSITSTIGIGQTVQDERVILLESPETVKAKLENALVPEILSRYEDDEIRLQEFAVSIPKNSDLVVLQTKVKDDEIELFSQILTEMTDAIEQDHERILRPIRSSIKASIQQRELELKREKDQRFYEPVFKGMEAEIKAAEVNLAKLQDPTIQGYKIKALEIQLENEKRQLASIKEREAILKNKKERLDSLSDLLIYQIAELKEQIQGAIKLRQQSVAQAKSGTQGMAMLLIDNELQQNRTRLATLEERLYIDLENQHSELQKEINDNHREQVHQLALIDEKEKSLQKYLVENKLGIEQQKKQIERVQAEKTQIPADREQKIEGLEQQISMLNEQLSNLIETSTVAEPMRSQEPVGLSRGLVVILAGVLGVVLGLFSTFIAEFVGKVKRHEQEALEDGG